MSRHFQILQHVSQEQNLFQTEGGAAGPTVAAEREAPQSGGLPAAKSASLPIHWYDAFKLKARNWQRQVQALSHANNGNHLDAIAHEEEIKLVQRVFRAGSGRSPQVVLFSGVEADAGCAATCARVGEILATRPEASVCVVDANLRSPCLHQYFGIQNARGLADAVLEPGPVQNFAQRVSDRNLWVMPSGFAAPGLHLSLFSDRLQSRLTELRSIFKNLVVCSSPFALDSDSLLLSQWTDGVVLVVEAHATRRGTALRVKENLEIANVPMLGVVLRNRTFPIPEAIYRKL